MHILFVPMKLWFYFNFFSRLLLFGLLWLYYYLINSSIFSKIKIKLNTNLSVCGDLTVTRMQYALLQIYKWYIGLKMGGK